MIWLPWREWFALTANINRDSKKKPTPFKGTDFIRLSFDEIEEQTESEPKMPDLERIKKKYGAIPSPEVNGK